MPHVKVAPLQLLPDHTHALTTCRQCMSSSQTTVGFCPPHRLLMWPLHVPCSIIANESILSEAEVLSYWPVTNSGTCLHFNRIMWSSVLQTCTAYHWMGNALSLGGKSDSMVSLARGMHVQMVVGMWVHTCAHCAYLWHVWVGEWLCLSAFDMRWHNLDEQWYCISDWSQLSTLWENAEIA